MRIPLIAGNWKMHKTVRESVDFARGLLEAIGEVNGVEVAVAPPFTALHPVAEVLKGGAIRLAAQNIFWEESGAYTGETSGPMLAEAGCSLVIIGHSERRQYFDETDETVNRRLFAALAAELHPIVCIGETRAAPGRPDLRGRGQPARGRADQRRSRPDRKRRHRL